MREGKGTHKPSSTTNDGSSCIIGFPQPPAISAILQHGPISMCNFTNFDVQGTENSPVNTPNQNPRIRTRNSVHEPAKLPILPRLQRPSIILPDHLLLLHTPNPPLRPQIVIAHHKPKAPQHSALQRDSRNNNPIPALQQLRVRVPGASGETTADSLQDEARDVGGDEDEGVEARAQAREGRVEGERYVL